MLKGKLCNLLTLLDLTQAALARVILGCVKSLGVEIEVDGCVMPLSGVG